MLIASCVGDGATASAEPESQAARPSVPTKASPSRAARSRLVMVICSSWLVDPSPAARAKTAIAGRNGTRVRCLGERKLQADGSCQLTTHAWLGGQKCRRRTVDYSTGHSAG